MIERLDPIIRHNAWGDFEAIATMQGRPRAEQPEAELWMGAHPLGPSIVRSSGEPLNRWIEHSPNVLLGHDVAHRFGQLPFLAKVLAAAEPLSIQAHPSLDQATVGFAREEAAGIPRDARERTYRDANHKPELICALTPFEAKCGFRTLADSRRLFAQLTDAGLDPIRARLASAGADDVVIRDVLSWLLRLDEASKAELVGAVRRGVAKAESGEYSPEFAWVEPMHALYNDDPGVIVALLLNHVVLEPGEALFLESGNVHSYLKGVGVELMANSDNVIRCGLTPKHVDIEELIAVVNYVPGSPPIQRPVGPIHTFASPVPEFSLTRVTEASGYRFTPTGPEILLVTSGEFAVSTTDATDPVVLGHGDVVFVGAGSGSCRADGHGMLWRCTSGNI